MTKTFSIITNGVRISEASVRKYPTSYIRPTGIPNRVTNTNAAEVKLKFIYPETSITPVQTRRIYTQYIINSTANPNYVNATRSLTYLYPSGESTGRLAQAACVPNIEYLAEEGAYKLKWNFPTTPNGVSTFESLGFFGTICRPLFLGWHSDIRYSSYFYYGEIIAQFESFVPTWRKVS